MMSLGLGMRYNESGPSVCAPEPRYHQEEPLMASYLTAPERFWSKVEFTGSCWLWRASRAGRMGYGSFWNGSAQVLAHRWAYEFCVGPIPEGLTIDHLCLVVLCVRPDHLEPVSNRENVLRGGGACAQNARKTQCKRGHELTENNIYRRPGRPRERECLMCRTQQQIERPSGVDNH